MAPEHKDKGSSTSGCSARLNGLLDAAGFPAEGEGRGSEFARRFAVSKANASRWLKDDTLPRDYDELDRIARALGSSASYWAYGEQADPAPLDFVLVGRCVNAILSYLDKHAGDPLKIDDDILVGAYGELYQSARANGGKIDSDLVAGAAVRVLAAQHRKHSG